MYVQYISCQYFIHSSCPFPFVVSPSSSFLLYLCYCRMVRPIDLYLINVYIHCFSAAFPSCEWMRGGQSSRNPVTMALRRNTGLLSHTHHCPPDFTQTKSPPTNEPSPPLKTSPTNSDITKAQNTAPQKNNVAWKQVKHLQYEHMHAIWHAWRFCCKSNHERTPTSYCMCLMCWLRASHLRVFQQEYVLTEAASPRGPEFTKREEGERHKIKITTK